MAEANKGFPWRVGMQSVPDRHGRVYRVFRVPALRDGSPEEVAEGPPIADALCVAKVGPYERGASMVFELDEDDAPDRDDPATIGAFLGAVREAYPEWFAISCQYRGSVEAWNVVARRKDYRDRNDHRILGEGATEWDAIEAAWNVRPGVKRD